MIAFLRISQNGHYQFEKGMIDEDIWSGYRERILLWVSEPGARQWWSENRASFSQTFAAFIDRELDRRAA